LTLATFAETDSLTALDLAPRGSLLDWIDNFLAAPNSFLGRTAGKIYNFMMITHLIPDDVERQIHAKAHCFRPRWDLLEARDERTYRSVTGDYLLACDFAIDEAISASSDRGSQFQRLNPDEHGDYARLNLEEGYPFWNQRLWDVAEPCAPQWMLRPRLVARLEAQGFPNRGPRRLPTPSSRGPRTARASGPIHPEPPEANARLPGRVQ
jgi:hypothetical protein